MTSVMASPTPAGEVTEAMEDITLNEVVSFPDTNADGADSPKSPSSPRLKDAASPGRRRWFGKKSPSHLKMNSPKASPIQEGEVTEPMEDISLVPAVISFPEDRGDCPQSPNSPCSEDGAEPHTSPSSSCSNDEEEAEEAAPAPRFRWFGPKSRSHAKLSRSGTGDMSDMKESRSFLKMHRSGTDETVFPTSRSFLKMRRSGTVDDSNPSLLSNRVPYAPLSLSHKQRALSAWPGLALLPVESGAHAHNLLVCGMNAIRAEVLDMLAMVSAMEEHKKVLTHAAVERFFAWTPAFATFVERYFFVEEDIVLTLIEERLGKVHGRMKTSSRMKMRGCLQKAIRDLHETSVTFVPSLPAGERFAGLARCAAAVAQTAQTYTRTFVDVLVPLVRGAYSKSDVEKMRTRLIKYIVSHVGADDLLVLYTRWMTPRQVARWRAQALFPAEFKFRSYHKWEKNVMLGHFVIPARFADVLKAETTEEENDADTAAELWREQMRRAQGDRANIQAGFLEGEYDDSEESGGSAGSGEKVLLEYGGAHRNVAIVGAE